MVTAKEKPLVDTQKIMIKGLKHTKNNNNKKSSDHKGR